MSTQINPKILRIYPIKCQILDDGLTRRSCILQRLSGETIEDQDVLYFDLSSTIPLPEDDDCDSYLLAALMDAMGEGRNIEVYGSVSRSLLGNLVEFQAAWHKWLPDMYQLVGMEATRLRSSQKTNNNYIGAFSGGVDATFTVYRHAKNLCSYRTKEISRCVQVHGFDIPLAKPKAFQQSRTQAEKSLRDLNLDLDIIRTNYRLISKVGWWHSAIIALVAALNHYKLVAGGCLVGSSESYDSIILPWCSNPITDPLLGCDEFAIIHDGASHSRTEKIEIISEWQQGISGLRVCWQAGAATGTNCGQCEKCVRTKLNFLAAGLHLPDCIPPAKAPAVDITDQIRGLKIRNRFSRKELSSIHAHATRKGLNGPWLEALQQLLARN